MTESPPIRNFLPLTVEKAAATPPPGWRWKALVELARLESGHTPSRYHPEWWGGDIPWISLADIRDLDGKVAYETHEYTNEAGIANSSARVLPQGTVVLSRTASVGFVTIIGRPMATSQDFVNWICGPELDPWFLAYLLMASRDYIRSLGSGAVHRTVYMPTVEAFRVCVPPLEEQRRIIDLLCQGLAHAEQARAAAEIQAEAASSIGSAVLRSVFLDDSQKRWPVVNLESVSEIVSGVTLGRRPPVGSTRTVPYLTVANVKDGYLELEDVRSVEIADAELEKWRLEPGDLLLTEGGDADKLGRGTTFRGEIVDCIHQNHIFRVRFRASECLAEFAAAQVSSPYGKAYFLAHAKQTTGIATINQGVLRAFPLLRPPIPEQERIVADLRACSHEVRQLQRHADAQLQTVKALPTALLQQAFMGEL